MTEFYSLASVGSAYFRDGEGMGMCFKADREEEILICKLPVVPPQRTKDMDDITAFSGALSYVSHPSSYYK